MKKTVFMRILGALMCAALTLSLCACAPRDNDKTQAQPGTIRVVATIFPLADWARELIGDVPGVELTTLLTSGADMHSHQPTAADIRAIATCDLFIYVGGESDRWVEDVLSQSAGPDTVALRMLDAVESRAVAEELVEGMQADEDEGEEDEAPDEHIWLSPKNARLCCGALAEALISVDPDHRAAYEANLSAYDARLLALDGAYAEMIAAAPRRTVLFGDRFPFRYLTEDYGLTYYAAFPGCSAETEASFETIVFLAGKVDELGLGCVLTIDGSDQSIARTIVDSCGRPDVQILTMNAMQGAEAEGESYITLMEKNLNVLREALK